MDCPKCGHAFETMLAGGCPRCGSLMAEGGPEEVRAGFWVRFAAYQVDKLLLAIVGLVLSTLAGALASMVPGLSGIAGLVGILVGIAVSALYFTLMTARDGQTLGKKLIRIKVVGEDGSPVSAGQALGRWACYYLCALPLYLGFFWVGFTQAKKGFHDMICGTKVIYVDPKERRSGVVAAVIIVCCFFFIVAVVGVLAAVAIPKFADLIRSAGEGASKGNLGAVRSALSIYYGDMEGQYPADIEAMIPKYLKQVPLAKTAPHHPDSSEVHYVAPLRQAPLSPDAGGWRYNNDPNDKDYGSFFVNCTHTDSRGKAWDSY